MQARKDEHFAPVAHYVRLLDLATDLDEAGDGRLLGLVHLLDDMLAHEQDARPTMADAHTHMAECLAALST